MNDLAPSRPNSEKAIQAWIERGLNPEQVFRRPLLMFEVTLALIDVASDPKIRYTLANSDYIQRAQHLTTHMTTFGHLRLASHIISARFNFKNQK